MSTHLRQGRGFTLIEVMVAAAIAGVLAAIAFAGVSAVQTAAGIQARAAGLNSAGRHALEIMGRDIRGAGDSLELNVASCLGNPNNFQVPGPDVTPCPAILEPHPWRIILARYMWLDGGDGDQYSLDDRPRPGGALTDDVRNVVAYEFVPDRADLVAWTDCSLDRNSCAQRQAWTGRIDRIVNPFGFAGVAEVRQVLVDNVILDDALSVDAVTIPPAPEPDASFALFRYQVAFGPNELNGPGGVVDRATLTGTLLSPPLRFFPIAPPQALADIVAAGALPYAGWGYAGEIVGWRGDGSAEVALLQDSGGVVGDLADAESDVRYLIDRNRFRAVRVSFKTYDQRNPETGLPLEDPAHGHGIDVDQDPGNGTARVTWFQTSFEIRALSLDTMQFEQFRPADEG